MNLLLTYLLIGSYGLLLVRRGIHTSQGTGCAIRYWPHFRLRPHVIRSIFYAWLLISPGVYAQRYVDISAEIELISYRIDGTNELTEKRWTYQIQCIVGTNEWRIDSDFLRNGTEAWYFDGSDVYHRIQQTAEVSLLDNVSNARQPTILPYEQVKSNVTFSIVPSPGGHPLGNLGVNIPWLAFCSGSYLRSAKRIVPIPTTEIRNTPSAFAYTDKVQAFEDEFGLPMVLELYTSQAEYKKSVMDERLVRYDPRVREERRNPISERADGILAFRYVVNDATNFLGWMLPTKFNYQTYRVDQGEARLFVAGVGKVISVRESNKPDHVFLPHLRQTFLDHRFRHPSRVVDGIVYQIAGATGLPSTNDSVLRAQFDRAVKRAPVEGAGDARRRVVVILLLLILGIVPLLALLLSRRRAYKFNKPTG